MVMNPSSDRNPAAIALLVSGAIGIVLGAILWITGANLLGQDTQAGVYLHAVGLDNGMDLSAHSPAMDADQALIWWGIALVILGVLLVVARLIIAAARPKVVVERPSHPSWWKADAKNDK